MIGSWSVQKRIVGSAGHHATDQTPILRGGTRPAMMLINFHSAFFGAALLPCYDEAGAIFVSQ
jgi:hypothetical protein